MNRDHYLKICTLNLVDPLMIEWILCYYILEESISILGMSGYIL